MRTDWDAYARCYDNLVRLTPYKATLNTVAQQVLSRNPRIILDASCGTGNFEATLSSLGFADQVVGVDFSEEMLTRAKNKSYPFSVSHIPVDLNRRLPFTEEAFDSVVSINTLYALKDPSRTLRQFHRVLSPSGFLFLVTPKEDYENGLILWEHVQDGSQKEDWVNAHASKEREEFLLRKVFADESVVQEMLLIAEHNRIIATNTTFHFFTKEDLLQRVSEAGFRVVDYDTVSADQDHFLIAQKG